MPRKIVILSAFQDYRTLKRASIQNVAQALAEQGDDVSFVSTRFSLISKYTGDSRNFLSRRSNRFEMVDGVRCYLWQTALHPFATGRAWIDALSPALFDAYAAWPNDNVDALLSAADFVVVESSVAVIYLRRIRRLNAGCRIVYYATDLLDTVGAHPYVQKRLEADAALIDHIMVRSSVMSPAFAFAKCPKYRAGFGVNLSDFASEAPNPYEPGLHAVAVGSMLFDRLPFTHAAPLLPEIHFHVIGCGENFDAPANVKIYPEMKFQATLPFIRHATIGMATYRNGPSVKYLAESSLKLAQYALFGIPAVCPDFAAAGHEGRFPYIVGDTDSMVTAIKNAVAERGSIIPQTFPTWKQVANDVIKPLTLPL